MELAKNWTYDEPTDRYPIEEAQIQAIWEWERRVGDPEFLAPITRVVCYPYFNPEVWGWCVWFCIPAIHEWRRFLMRDQDGDLPLPWQMKEATGEWVNDD